MNVGPFFGGNNLSDFGTMVTVHRVDKADASPADTARIKRLAQDMVAGPGGSLSDYANFNLTFGGSSSKEGGAGILIILTQYWGDDDAGNDGLSDEALIARDTPLAEQFGYELRNLIGDAFAVKVYCGNW